MRMILALLAGPAVLLASTAVRGQSEPAQPPVVSGDVRDVAVSACMAEAKAQAVKTGASDVKLKDVEDTDKKSNRRAHVRAKVTVISIDPNGKEKKKKKKFKCDTQNGVVTEFKFY
jgi:hypothetical protein